MELCVSAPEKRKTFGVAGFRTSVAGQISSNLSNRFKKVGNIASTYGSPLEAIEKGIGNNVPTPRSYNGMIRITCLPLMRSKPIYFLFRNQHFLIASTVNIAITPWSFDD